jgi:hypothetical protein
MDFTSRFTSHEFVRREFHGWKTSGEERKSLRDFAADSHTLKKLGTSVGK